MRALILALALVGCTQQPSAVETYTYTKCMNQFTVHEAKISEACADLAKSVANKDEKGQRIAARNLNYYQQLEAFSVVIAKWEDPVRRAEETETAAHHLSNLKIATDRANAAE